MDTPDGRGTVTDVNLLRQSVRVRMEKDPEDIHCYKNCEICVLRNGKARKTDPPIPDDLAPISGNRQRQAADPYPRFERRLNTAAQERKPEAALQKPEGDAAPKSEPSHRRRRGGRGHGRQEQQAAMEKAVQKQERPPQIQKAVAPKAAPTARQEQRQDNRQQPAGEQKRRSKPHRYYHNKRPKKPEQS